MSEKVKRPLMSVIVTWVLRFFCGGLFVFSGFVKAIDPWGTIFKFLEYFSAFGIDIPSPLIRLGVFALCMLEFIIGIFLMLGCFRKSCPWFAAMIMLVMLPLSLWLAIATPINDCGCFGDAVHISNWATFWKNVALSGGIVWLIGNNLKAMCLISPAFQWLAVVSSGVFLLVVLIIGFFYQPLIDFRNFPVGESLFAKDTGEESEPEYLFTYEKAGKLKEFTIDSLPAENSGWIFKGRKENFKENEIIISGEKMHVFDPISGEDLTEELGSETGRELLVMIPDVVEVSPATTWKLNALYEWCENNRVTMSGIVSGSLEEIDNWEDLSMASYPIYVADDTVIKEVVRGNPGIVFLENNIIKWKSSLSAIDLDDAQENIQEDIYPSLLSRNSKVLSKIIFIYLLFIAFLILISFTPRLASLLTKGGLASKRGVRHH